VRGLAVGEFAEEPAEWGQGVVDPRWKVRRLLQLGGQRSEEFAAGGTSPAFEPGFEPFFSNELEPGATDEFDPRGGEMGSGEILMPSFPAASAGDELAAGDGEFEKLGRRGERSALPHPHD
jgi:hypothetical protein